MADKMDDIEITKRCAMAMGYGDWAQRVRNGKLGLRRSAPGRGQTYQRYDPLTDDQQAMALVKRFNLRVMPVRGPEGFTGKWRTHNTYDFPEIGFIDAADLNRAICLAIAALERGK